MTEFEVDDNYITENIPIEAMTDDELLKNRDYIYGTYRNKNYLNQIDQEIKDRGLGSPSWQQDDAEYEKQFEVNTSYDQDEEIGSTPSAYFAHSQPINAKNGDNFMSIQRLDEGNPNHDKSDGKFTSGSGGVSNSSTDNDGISQKVMSKYPQLDKEFVDEQIDESVELREKATKSNNEMQKDFNKNLDNVVVSGRVKGIDSMIGKLARKPELYATVSDLNDVSGVRVMAENLNDVFKSLDYIKDNYNVVEEKNNIDVDRDGYRSYHAIIDDGSGVLSEIQIRTKNEDVWANYVHDRIYKPSNKKLKNYVSKNKEMVTNYILGMSEYFHNVDRGDVSEKPDCPEKIEVMMGCM
jgi:ppGpp synthetase/RelA/SpoT-type nucleotidyltranferase|tara:strand:- start:635 stop:1690 length:1056 start_codon:yes stop_codon:yes gene_type:complete